MSLRKQFKRDKTFEMLTAGNQKQPQRSKIKSVSHSSSSGKANGISFDPQMDLDRLKDFFEFSSMQSTRLPFDQNTHSQIFAAAQLIEKIMMTNVMPSYLTSMFGGGQVIERTHPEEMADPSLVDMMKKTIEKMFSNNKIITNYEPRLVKAGKSYQSKHNVNQKPSSKDSLRGALSNSQRKLTCQLSNPLPVDASTKMVRGQEEWVNNSRHKNFISQILKCLECSESFDTLAELSVHMLNSNHFVKSHPATHTVNGSNTTTLKKISYKPPISDLLSPRSKQSHHEKHISYNSELMTRKKQPATSPAQQITDVNNPNNVCKLKNLIPLRTMCQICKRTFDNKQHSSQSSATQLPPLVRLIQHLQNTHRINHICTNCGDYFSTSAQLQNHLATENHSHQYGVQRHNHNQQQYHSKSSFVARGNTLKLTDILKVNTTGEVRRDQHVCDEPNGLIISSPTNSTNDSLSGHSTYSTNSSSSPSSFIFETLSQSSRGVKSKREVSNNSSQSQSLVNNNTGNHLLALQRLVNGNTQLDSNNQSSSISNSNQFRVKSQQQEQSFSPLTTRELTRGSLSDPAELTKSPLNKSQAIKLPAKKRPYINENVCESDGDDLSDTSVNNESSVKRSRSDMDSVSSAVRESTSGPCSPLNLLQKMHLSLDSYLMR